MAAQQTPNAQQSGTEPQVITVSNTTPDLYEYEMATRLAEWHAQPLEPKFTGRQWLPLVTMTLILPAIALFLGWFL